MSTEPSDGREPSPPEVKPAAAAPVAASPTAMSAAAVIPIAPMPPMPDVPPIESLPRPYVPRPKPVIIPERTARGFGTAHVEIERAAARAFYITIKPADRPPQRVYLAPGILDGLIDLCASPALEPGLLWRRFCDIPLERPLPNRALEEELRILLTTFGPELHKPA